MVSHGHVEGLLYLFVSPSCEILPSGFEPTRKELIGRAWANASTAPGLQRSHRRNVEPHPQVRI